MRAHHSTRPDTQIEKQSGSVMNTATVVSFKLHQCADRIRRAYDRAQKADAEWIEATLELAMALAEARAGCGDDDRAFGHWLVDNDLDHIGRDDRSALINMARDLPLTRKVLQETTRRSWRMIWLEDMQLIYRSAAIGASPDPIQPEPASQEPIAGQSDSDDAAPEKEPKEVTSRSPFFGLPRASEVVNIYLSKKTRVHIGKAIK